MKNDKVVTTKSLKTIPDGKSQKKVTKKSGTAASLSNIITSAVGKTIARTGSGLANEGTGVSYEEER